MKNGGHPFGMDMPFRTFGTSARYGFNGKERDKDLHSLTAYDYGFRIYNPALGKFLSVDPLTKEYPMLTPYQFASNEPIQSVDIDGLEKIDYRLIIENGQPKLQTLGTVGKNRVWQGYLGFLGEYEDVPLYHHIEYNGHTYNFSDGRNHKQLKSLWEENRPKSLYFMKDQEQFVNDPESFVKSHESDQQIAQREDEGMTNMMKWQNATAMGQMGLPRPPGSGYLPSGTPVKLKGPVTSKVFSIYSDGTPVTGRPQRLPWAGGQPMPDIEANGSPHTRLRWDYANGRIYQAREFGNNGIALRDIDFTIQTFPNGTPRPNHYAPEQHLFMPNPVGGSSIRALGQRMLAPLQPNFIPFNLGSTYTYRGSFIFSTDNTERIKK